MDFIRDRLSLQRLSHWRGTDDTSAAIFRRTPQLSLLASNLNAAAVL